MSFKDLDLELHYDSEKYDLIEEFYTPVLSEAVEYYRAVGFFNSKSLSLVASGLKKFILNKGKMKLVCGADLSPEDVKSIVLGYESPDEILTNNFFKDLDSLEDNIKKDHIQVLGWMIANNLLDIKIAFKLDHFGNLKSREDGILHYKIGILKDFQNNYISFSGSNNETAAAWSKNIESFDIFRSWYSGESDHLLEHIDLFNRTFMGKDELIKVIDVPNAVKNKLIDMSPVEFHDLKFHDVKSENNINMENKPVLFEYQVEAIDNWFNNGKKGIFSMATGTGKTFTALGCLDKLLDEENKLVIIISVPYQHLIQQWKRSIEQFGILSKIDKILTVDGTNPKGKTQFKEYLLKIDLGFFNKMIVLTTHVSLASDEFTDSIKNKNIHSNFLLVGDELHGLGSHTRLQGLLNEYDYRLGLSATPERMYDDVGTNSLFNFFGDIVYSFDLEKALTEINPLTNLTYLTPYEYYPFFVELTYDELYDYEEITSKIAKECNDKGNKNINYKKVEGLLFNRANILKNAKDKFDKLRLILNELEDKDNLLIYCSEKQIGKVLDIVGNEFNLSVKSFTNNDNSKPQKSNNFKSDRDIILEDFKNGFYSCIVSMHCLDEGVDVPLASKAILMCNSTNSREFIQRVGRVIRRHEKKTFAQVYDMIIKPSKFSEFSEIERKIFLKEKERADKIGKLALNKSSYVKKMYGC